MLDSYRTHFINDLRANDLRANDLYTANKDFT